MMPPDQLRSPTAIKVLLPPLELTVAERSLESAGGVVPLGGGASDISFALKFRTGQRVEVNIAAAREFPAGIEDPRRRAFAVF
jgi:hypothetical protein